MDYEKKYKEALEKAKRLYEKGTITESLCHIFPELAESEDEKIRKALLRFHKSSIDVDGIKGEKIIAWLEKQGEEKTVNYPFEGMFPYTDPADTLDGEIENIWNKLRNCDNTFTAAKSGFYEVIHHLANWLEKQVKQKSTDKPKFEIGDEIKTDNEDPLTITKIDEQGYPCG